MATTKRQTTEQRRAAQGWKDASSVPNTEQSEYKTRAKNLPAMIQINGVGTAMAFLLSKPKKKAYKLIYDHLSAWVLQEVTTDDGKRYDSLMNFIRGVDVSTYRRATTEAIEYAIWLKRYVEAWADVKESDE